MTSNEHAKQIQANLDNVNQTVLDFLMANKLLIAIGVNLALAFHQLFLLNLHQMVFHLIYVHSLHHLIN